jgi:hypothetical protein
MTLTDDFGKGTDLRKIYLVHALQDSYISRNDGAPYDRSDYYANPHEYRSEFHTKVRPSLSSSISVWLNSLLAN